MSTPFIVAGNWKMNMGPDEAQDYFSSFVESSVYSSEGIETLFFPPSIDLLVAQNKLAGTSIGWGAQNIHSESQGAFTGEISASMISNMGATHVLVGHSERRTLFGERDEDCAKKVKAAQESNLVPVLCIGESLEQRQGEKTKDVLKEQLQKSLLHHDENKKIIVAYEPVWAIGTGEVASVQQVQEAHEFIRKQLVTLCKGDSIPILYGGSVKAQNAEALSQVSEVGGFLVGGASLKVDSFNDIIKASLS